jgi:chromate transporter
LAVKPTTRTALGAKKSIFRPPRGKYLPPAQVRRIRYLIFLRDVLVLSLTCFGGPQAHLARFLKTLVQERGYISEEELLELQALCQLLPGPTSTQTLTAIAFKIGGPNLAYLTLLIWVLPSALFMALLGMSLNFLKEQQISFSFARFLPAVAVGLVLHSGYIIARKVIVNLSVGIMALIAAFVSYYFQSPYVAPLVVLAGGLITAIEYRKLEPQEQKDPLQVEWGNFILFLAVPVLAALIGALTHWLPIRLFENFYRNGSLIFGGGQVLTPILYTEFVQFKHYLSQEEFLSGWAMVQVAPGPIFSFAAFIAALSMQEYGWSGQLTGAALATAGIFLPGTFLIFFVYRFWNQLKQYRGVRASLEGITAASVGLIGAAALLLLQALPNKSTDLPIVLLSFLMQQFTRIPQALLILLTLAAGFAYNSFLY